MIRSTVLKTLHVFSRVNDMTSNHDFQIPDVKSWFPDSWFHFHDAALLDMTTNWWNYKKKKEFFHHVHNRAGRSSERWTWRSLQGSFKIKVLWKWGQVHGEGFLGTQKGSSSAVEWWSVCVWGLCLLLRRSWPHHGTIVFWWTGSAPTWTPEKQIIYNINIILIQPNNIHKYDTYITK